MAQPRRWLLLSANSGSIRLLFSAGLFWLSVFRFQSQWNAASIATNQSIVRRRSLLLVDMSATSSTEKQQEKMGGNGGGRLLYIVTTMSMYDTGRRETTKGYDRFAKSLIPVIAETTKSLLTESSNLITQVDVYLVAFFPVNETRRLQLRRALPNHVGLEIWDEAAPLMYDFQRNKLLKDGKAISNHTRGLSRQHRFVVKDKLLHYDYFVVLEDDMILHGTQMQNYVQITNHLFHLRTTTNATRRRSSSRVMMDPTLDFHGPMTAPMLQRTIPGWFRVEAALPGWKPNDQNLYEQIPIDYDWTIQNNNNNSGSSIRSNKQKRTENINVELNPSYCCHVHNQTVNDHIPFRPTIRDLYFWETSIDALGVRKFPSIAASGSESSTLSSTSLSSSSFSFDWALLLVGTTEYDAKEAAVYDYWAGRDPASPPNHGYFFGMHETGQNLRPPGTKGRYMNNQGGWTATRRQVIEWHSLECTKHVGGFLPPFDKPGYRYDGLAAESVEYWSGGQQLASSHGCNLLRIIPLEPSMFERQLLYHSSNNKQRQDNVQHRFSSRNIQEFWGQLNTVRKNAERAILRQPEQERQLVQ